MTTNNIEVGCIVWDEEGNDLEVVRVSETEVELEDGRIVAKVELDCHPTFGWQIVWE